MLAIFFFDYLWHSDTSTMIMDVGLIYVVVTL